MKTLFERWRDYIADLMRQERFTLAALISVGSGVLVLGVISLVLAVVIAKFGMIGYTLLILVAAFFWIRYVLKDWHRKFMRDDSDFDGY